MNNYIDYSKYTITSTSQFDDGLAKLRDEHKDAEVAKIFKCIDEIIQDADMYEKEYARPLENFRKLMHIHLDGKRTGDIILLYKVDGHDIDLDLRLYNITDHKNLDRVGSPKFVNRQSLHDFDVVANKFTQDQIDYVEECYLNLISDYRFHQKHGDARKAYTESYLKDYFDSTGGSISLTFDEFMQIVNYVESYHKKSIFGSIDFSTPQRTLPITEHEELYILNLIQDYGLDIDDAYIESETDEWGDTYEYLCVDVYSDDFKTSKLMESELYSLEDIFEITFESAANGLGSFGRTYEFSHYFA